MTAEQIKARKKELLKQREQLQADDDFENLLKQELEDYAAIRRSEHSKEVGGKLLEINAMIKMCEEFGA